MTECNYLHTDHEKSPVYIVRLVHDMVYVFRGRDQSIDLVKIIAMMMVLLLHTGVVRGWSGGYGPVPEVYQIAGIAMPLFLMASGYFRI